MNATKNTIVMEPNIYDFAHTEYAQDAFIAWVCSNYNQTTNSAKKVIAERFIKELLGVDLDFSHVVVRTQVKNIDILLTLTVSDEKYYVIIEDKTHSTHHNKQLERYIKTLNKSGIGDEHIYVVYYKTGHVLHTPNRLYCENKQYYYKPNERSEFELISDLRAKRSKIPSIKICDLAEINKFFDSVSNLIMDSNSEILQNYSEKIRQNFAHYSSTTISGDFPKTDELWAKAFDGFIDTVGKTKYPDILFKIDLYTGKYWEIYIASKVPIVNGGEPQKYDFPILNVRSDVFEGQTKRIYFFHFTGLRCWDNLSHREKEPKSATYVIDFGNLKHEELNSIDYLAPEVRIEDIHTLLDAICEEFDRFVVRRDGDQPFEL